MKSVKYVLAWAALCSSPMLFGQGVVDALKYSQQDIRGTARYMGMAGAFGALGGDITTLSQNPAGIGVYRNSDIAATIDLSNQVSSVNTAGVKSTDNKFNFSCNNFGFVWTVRFNQEALKNLNFGFAYNKQKSFDRTYKTAYSGITGASSLSGYIAKLSEGYTADNLGYSDNSSYDPYDQNPWLNVLGYQSYLINPKSTASNTWGSIVGNGSTATGDLYVREKGSIDEYNFNIGGNIYNVFYWGIGLTVTDFSYDVQSGYGENLTNGYLPDANGIMGSPNANGWYLMQNMLHTNGSGFKANLGVILRATNNFRLGFAFHTPNYYKMTDTYSASVKYDFTQGSTSYNDLAETPSGSYSYEFQAPWRMIASAAYVFGQGGILSFDYEYTASNGMSFDDPYTIDMFYNTNQEISEMVSPTHTFKVGGEFRITPQFSARLGYAYQTSPVKSEYRSGHEIPTAGTLTQFTLDRATNYFTVGLGYRFSNVYVDLAYMHRYRRSELFPFSPIPSTGENPFNPDEVEPSLAITPQISTLTDHNNSFVLTMGVKF
ncbi:OmpP1/FadL family transporter [Barnesiella viscericola]|nr:outer membrane protein transport protein [Barnesiella viscericola]